MSIDKKPRHHAAEIAALPTREQRRSALEDVPPEWRELVRRHVEVVFLLRGSAHKIGN